MNPSASDHIAALDALGREFRRIEEAGDSRRSVRLPHTRRGKLTLLLASALVLVGCSLTPAGHTVTGKLARLVGIGEPATLPPHHYVHISNRGTPIVIATGLAPDGSPYEIAVDRSVVHSPQPSPIPERVAKGLPKRQLRRLTARRFPKTAVATCISIDLPRTPAATMGLVCIDRTDRDFLSSRHILDGVNYLDRFAPDIAGQGSAGPAARYVVAAELSSNITRVVTSYVDENGQRAIAQTDVGQVTANIRREIGTADRVGYMITFLPDDGLPVGATGAGPGHRHGPGVLGTVKLAGFDAQGNRVAHYDLGRRESHRYAVENTRLAATHKFEAEIPAATVDGRMKLTRANVRLCGDALRKGVRARVCQDLIGRAARQGKFGWHTGG